MIIDGVNFNGINFIIFIVIALIVGAIVLLWYSEKRRKEHEDFVKRKSTALKELSNVNNKYSFYMRVGDYDESHVYDNENFYNNISCEDYLTYQLQFKKAHVEQDMRGVENNKKLYEEYEKEVNSIKRLGIYNCSTTKYNMQKLLKIENELFCKSKLKPPLNFSITVRLLCSTINGRVYDVKRRQFFAKEIFAIIKKLNNRNNGFYNDRDIWDAICRVERGRVSNKMRFAIYKRDGYCCRICGRSQHEDYLEIDHIKPIAKGGKSTMDNLQTLCSSCNKYKSDKY